MSLNASEQADFQYCGKVARQHYENFSVVSLFIPRALKPHFHAIYAFCRGVDDLGDEFAQDRRLALKEWRQQLQNAYHGRPSHPVFRALAATVHQFDLPYEEFDNLIQANEIDQDARAYQTIDDTLAYCHYSANPVGRLVLGLFGYHDARRYQWSDATCTALQLANFLQDTAIDLGRGRRYWPEEDLARFHLSSAELTRLALDPHPNQSAVRDWTLFEAARIDALFQDGRPLEFHVPTRLALQLQLYRMGGQAIVEAIRRQGANPLIRRPTVSSVQKLELMVRAIAGWPAHMNSRPTGGS